MEQQHFSHATKYKFKAYTFCLWWCVKTMTVWEKIDKDDDGDHGDGGVVVVVASPLV